MLSKRESEILNLIATGSKNLDIAKRLGLSIKTVENHIRSIFFKLRVNNRTEAVVTAIQYSLIKLTLMQSPEQQS